MSDMISLDDLYRRPLSTFEKSVLDYIKAHPKSNTEEIAAVWGHSERAYRAIAFLWMSMFADRDVRTGAITAREL